MQVQQVAIIRALVASGGTLNAVNKDNLTPLLLAEKSKKHEPAELSRAWDGCGWYRPKNDSREEVIAALRELMHLGTNDPAPVPPPAAVPTGKKETGDKDKQAKNTTEASAAISEQ